METERRPAERWCLGYRIPAIVVENDGTPIGKHYGRQITVSALNPKEKIGSYQQPRGLFLDGPQHNIGAYEVVLALVKDRDGRIRRAVDVTKRIRRSYGPAL